MTFSNRDFEKKWVVVPSERPRASPLVPVAIGCGVVLFAAMLAVVAAIVWLANTPDGGVKLANQMDSASLNYLARHRILNETERLVAYFDVTITMSGTESATVTTERVIYHKDGRTMSIPLGQIRDVRTEVDALGGYNIEVIGTAGDRMMIEIPAMNGGQTFLDALKETRRLATPSTPQGGPGP